MSTTAAVATAPKGGGNTYFYVFIVILIIALTVAIIFLFVYRSRYNVCRQSQSQFCYNLVCPGPRVEEDPCLGYAQRTNAQGKLECATSVPVFGKPPPEP